MKLDDISFDESDRNLFQVDDARLRSEAFKHSLVPRLRALLNECIALANRVYDLDALEDSRVAWFPQSREKRVAELTLLYESAFAGLGGKQGKQKWLGFSRKDGKPVQLLPFRYGLLLEKSGLQIYFENYWVGGLTDDSYRKLFDFHLQNEALINRLCYHSRIEPALYFGEGCEPFSTFRQHYEWMAENKQYANYFTSAYEKYPITSNDLWGIVENYVVFYPVYHSYIQIAKEAPVMFNELIAKLNVWMKQVNERREQDEDTDESDVPSSGMILSQARLTAEHKTRVMPALRWRVFQRDEWKCVACGRGSHDDVVLHIDHIVPRSKGGEDTLENYQTLCHLCNIGKSNKDDTDLRRDLSV